MNATNKKLMAPKLPTKPHKPIYAPLPPSKTISVHFNPLRITTYKSFSLDDLAKIISDHTQSPIETIRFEFSTARDWDDVVSIHLQCYGGSNQPNPDYAAQFANYEKRLKKFNTEKEAYSAKLKAYNKVLKQYKVDLEAYHLEQAKRTIEIIEARRKNKSKKGTEE